jgi:hypothetical protein
MKNYHLKALEDQILNWQIAAENTGHEGVSSWIRIALELVCNGTIKPEYTDEQMIRGRIPDREEVASDIQFRILESSIKHWHLSAERQGLGVQEWCRQSLNWVASNRYALELTRRAA